MRELEEFRRVARDPYTYAESLKKETGRPIIGSFCSYAPEEIVVAAGAVPFRIFGTRENITRADAHLQAYACSLARGSLEEALAGKLKFLDGTIFPHTCDTIQRLSDIWRLNAGIPLHWDVVLPVKLNTESARDYLAGVISKFRRDMETGLGVEIGEDALIEAVALFNRIRGNLNTLYEMRRKSPGLIDAGDLHAVVKSSMVMDRRDLAAKLEALVEALRRTEPRDVDGLHRLFLAGGVCSHPEIYSLLEESGGVTVWDDLCTGTRYFEGLIAESGDPVAAIADRYAIRAACPAKHASLVSRGDHLIRAVRESRARGVIFLFLKFCDPHAFDYPYLKSSLDEAGVPSMVLEVEEQLPPEGQLRTRLETFVSLL